VGSPSAARDVSRASFGEIVSVGSGTGSGGGVEGSRLGAVSEGSGSGVVLVGSGLGDVLDGSGLGDVLDGSGLGELDVDELELADGEAVDGAVLTAARASGLTKAAAVSQRAAGSTDSG
jgi:hypothetical protein